MTPSNTEAGIESELRSFWVRTISTLGVGTAFGGLMAAIMWYGFIIPSNTRQNNFETRQEKLVDSIIATNTALTDSNIQNVKTFQQIEAALASSGSSVQEALRSNGEVLRSNAVLLQGSALSHSQQIQQLEALTSLLERTTKLIEPTILNQSDQSKKLDAVLDSLQKKP